MYNIKCKNKKSDFPVQYIGWEKKGPQINYLQGGLLCTERRKDKERKVTVHDETESGRIPNEKLAAKIEDCLVLYASSNI